MPPKLISLFREVLVQRKDCYASQHCDPRAGGVYYRLNKRPVTEAVIQEHLNGNNTIATYPRRDGLTSWVVIDIDSRDRNEVLNVVEQLKSLQIEPLIEDSGNKGYHIWTFLQEPTPFKEARGLVREIADGLEVFPKQDRHAGSESFGSALKLPLGRHKKTGRWCQFLNDHFQPFKDQSAALKGVQRASRQFVSRILEVQKPVTAPRRTSWRSGTDSRGLSGALTISSIL